jgi:hypothetical protein
MFPVSILTGALTAFAQKKNPEKSYFFERGVVAAGIYVVSVCEVISKQGGIIMRHPVMGLVIPAVVTGIKMGAGHIIGGLAHDCIE